MHRFSDSLSDLVRIHTFDRVYQAVVIAMTTLLFAGLLVASVAFWPIIWQIAASDAALSPNCSDLVITGLALAVFSLLLGLALPDSRYSFLKSLMISYVAAICIIFTVMWFRPIEIAAVTGSAFWGLLRTVIHFFVSISFSLLPALLPSALAWLIREMYSIIASR